MSYTNIKDLVSPWDLITLGSIYSRKKSIEESFTMVVEANDYVKWFLRYQWFSAWWLWWLLTDLLITQWILIALRHFWYCLKGLLKGFWWPFRSLKSVKYFQSYGPNEACDTRYMGQYISTCNLCLHTKPTQYCKGNWSRVTPEESSENRMRLLGVYSTVYI